MSNAARLDEESVKYITPLVRATGCFFFLPGTPGYRRIGAQIGLLRFSFSPLKVWFLGSLVLI